MSQKKSKTGTTKPLTAGGQKPTSPKKKCVAVDQYMAHTSLHDIPTQFPRKGEMVAQSYTLPASVQQTAAKEFFCEVCHVTCNSDTVLRQHQAGKRHQKNVLIQAIKLNRLAASLLFH